MTTDTDRTFPLAWDEFERQFNRWADAYGLKRSRQRIRGRNFMADDVLGTFTIAKGEVVELSAVTFPNLTDRDEQGNLIHRTDRFVGITWLVDNSEDPPGRNGGLVSTFDELTDALVAGMPSEPVQ